MSAQGNPKFTNVKITFYQVWLSTHLLVHIFIFSSTASDWEVNTERTLCNKIYRFYQKQCWNCEIL